MHCDNIQQTHQLWWQTGDMGARLWIVSGRGLRRLPQSTDNASSDATGARRSDRLFHRTVCRRPSAAKFHRLAWPSD